MQDRLPVLSIRLRGDSHDSNEKPFPCAIENDVLGILEDIESQFDRLRTIRSDRSICGSGRAVRPPGHQGKPVDV